MNVQKTIKTKRPKVESTRNLRAFKGTMHNPQLSKQRKLDVKPKKNKDHKDKIAIKLTGRFQGK